MNQLLRLPLLKYTHSEKRNTYVKEKRKKVIITKKNSTILPLQEKKDSYNTPDRGLHGSSQGTGADTVVAKTSTPEVIAILHFLHFYVGAT